MGYMKPDDFIGFREFGLNRDVTKRIKADRNTHLEPVRVNSHIMGF